LANFGAAMKDNMLRFFAVEHIFTMAGGAGAGACRSSFI